MFDAECNAHQSDIVNNFFINANLTNTSSTLPPEVKKNNTVYSTFNNFVYLNRKFNLLEI